MNTLTCHEVWDKCLNVIKDNVSPQNFKTWFDPIVPVDVKNKTLTLQVPSSFFFEYLEEHYITLIKKTIKRFFDSLMPSLFGPKAIARLLILKTHLRIKRPILQFRLPHFHQSETELRMKLLH